MAMFEMAAPATGNHAQGVLSRFMRSIDAWRVRRGQRLALGEMLEWDGARLDDIGVSVQDLEDAQALGAPLQRTSRADLPWWW